MIKVGDKIYIRGSISISNGSSDVAGGIATVSNVRMGISAGKPTPFIEVKELPGHSYNWDMLSKEQEKLKARYGKDKAKPDPDIDRPWIQSGDTVNGEVYKGGDVW